MNEVSLIQASIEQLERLSRSIASIGETEDYTEVAINALEKQIPKKPKHTYIKHGKHTWRKDENGETDDFAWEYDYHNGVVCEVCGETVCVYCNPDYDKLEDCEEDIYNCPSCNEGVCYYQKLCDCGQKLDWSDEKCVKN